MRVGIYARRSAADEKAGRSVGEQETLGRADAERHQWTVAQVYTDDGRSASRFARKIRDEWGRLLADVEGGRLDVLWLWEVDRASRELEDWARFLNSCRRRKLLVHVHTHDRTYDPQVGRDWKTLAEDGVGAADASEKISVNVLRSLAAAASAGRPHGRVAFGYRRRWELDAASGKRRFVAEDIDPVQGPVVRDAYERVKGGESLRSICRDLNARRIPTVWAEEWTPNSLREILLRERNVGMRVYRGEVIGAGQWPALVDEATYAQVKALLTDPSRRHAESTAARHLLSVITKCGREGCDHIVVAGHYRGSPIYRCRRGHVVRQQVPCDEHVHNVMRAMLSSPEFAAAAAGRDGDQGRAARETVAALLAQLDLAADDYADGTITNRQLVRITARLQPQIDAAQAEADRHRQSGIVGQFAGPDGAALWDAATIEQQRALLAACFDIRLLPTGRGRRVFDPASIELTPK